MISGTNTADEWNVQTLFGQMLNDILKERLNVLHLRSVVWLVEYTWFKMHKWHLGVRLENAVEDFEHSNQPCCFQSWQRKISYP